MKHLCLALWTAALLAACGGGDAPPEAAAGAMREPAQVVAAAGAIAPPQPVDDRPLDVTVLLDWAEATYPTLFPGHKANLLLPPYEYRHYPETGNYVGVAGEDVYILGPVSNNELRRVGARDDFRCRVLPDSCVANGYARAGWTATLSTLQHGVSGTATIIDERTVRLSGFHYDGGGPQVYAYLGSENSNAAFLAGRVIGPRLNRPGAPYVDATIELQLPEGQTLDGFNALSIWCADFRVNFGSGAFRRGPLPAS